MKKLLSIKRLIIICIATMFAIILIPIIIFVSLMFMVMLSFDGSASFPAECGIVFGAAVHRDSTAGPGILRRVGAASDLYKEGQLKRLYLTGGMGSPFQEKSEAEVMKEIAIGQGIDPADIILEEESTSTWQNLRFTKPLTEDCESIVGISDRYHLARISFLAKKQGWGSLMTHPAPASTSTHFELWNVVREALGIGYYSLPGSFQRLE